MLGGKNKQPLGYTIIEVLIVLTVSGVMFLIAANFINGKQQKEAFDTSIHTLGSQIEEVINEVTEGHFSDIPKPCSAVAGGPLDFVTVDPMIPQMQGARSNCVFLGKVMFFTNRHTFYKISLAGNRLLTADTLATNPTEANITYIPDFTSEEPIQNNLDIRYINFGGSATNLYSVAFIQGQGKYDNGSLSSGSQVVFLYYDQAHNSNNAGQSGVESNINSSTLNQANRARFCVTDGTYYADILIAGRYATGHGHLVVDVANRGRNAC